MRLFEIIERETIRLSRMVSLIGLLGLIAVIFATMADILMRWLFNKPITGVRDASSLFLAVIIVSFFPICLAKGGNIAFRFLGDMLGPRWRDLLEAFGNLVTLMVFVAIAWQIWGYADYLAKNRETTWVLGWPVAPWWRGVCIILAFCVVVELCVIRKLLISALSGKKSET
jgi:TRAP-type C4-dicarboxylate transport system permease small subunit